MAKKMFLDATKVTFEQAAMLRANMTMAEKKLWNYLRQKPLGYKFRRQHAISKYIVDFYCHPLTLVIEVDGEVHDIQQVATNDRIRQDYLVSQGCKFLRFTNSDVENRFDTVTNKIEQFLKGQ